MTPHASSRSAGGTVMDEAFDVDVLLAWGRDWQRYLEAGPGEDLQISIPVRPQYGTLANEALTRQRPAPAVKRRGGRPKGTGMGDAVAALIASDVLEEDAVRIIAAHHGKPADKVRDALRRHRSRKK